MLSTGDDVATGIFTTRTGASFWLYLGALALPAITVIWFFIQPAILALVTTLLIIALQSLLGVRYAQQSKSHCLAHKRGEWSLTVLGSREKQQSECEADMISLELPVIRLPECLLLFYSTRSKSKGVLVFWRDSLGEDKFRQLSRLLSREEFLLSRS